MRFFINYITPFGTTPVFCYMDAVSGCITRGIPGCRNWVCSTVYYEIVMGVVSNSKCISARHACRFPFLVHVSDHCNCEAGTASVSCLNLSLGLRFDLHIVCYTDIRTPRVAASLSLHSESVLYKFLLKRRPADCYCSLIRGAPPFSYLSKSLLACIDQSSDW